MKIYLAGNPGSGSGEVVKTREQKTQLLHNRRLLSYWDYLEDKAVLSFTLIKANKK